MGLPADFTSFVPTGTDERSSLAGEAWVQIARLFLSQQATREEVATDLGLHLSDMISLFHIQPDHGVTQRALAEHWACDPSWVTNRIDRLEQLHLAERRLSPTDRRVKEVWLTPEGERVRAKGLAGFSAPPDLLVALPIEHLRALARALAELDLPDPTQIATKAPLAAPTA